MAWLAAAAPYLTAASAVIGVGSTLMAGKQQDAYAKFEAGQLEANAKSERAASQRQAADEKKRSDYLQSRATALAASGGGAANDPTIENIIAGLDSEGEYRALSALYNGEQAASGMEMGANVRRIEGRNGRRTANYKAANTLMSSGASLYEKYGELNAAHS